MLAIPFEGKQCKQNILLLVKLSWLGLYPTEESIVARNELWKQPEKSKNVVEGMHILKTNAEKLN